MSSTLMEAATFVGRLLLAAIFLHEAWSKLTGYPAALAYMQAFGVPGLLLPFAIAVELGCGVLIVGGYHTRIAALLLAGVLPGYRRPVPRQARRPQSAPPFREGHGDRGWAAGAVCPWRGGLGARCVAGVCTWALAGPES